MGKLTVVLLVIILGTFVYTLKDYKPIGIQRSAK